ncbi:DUF6126 family protein [Streptomyces sp. NPDC006990]|uniref:DUF6126 family protein n=1 Tax=unclassified Streptomyces TaxID=2593676 RepID=UPI003454FDD6
MTSSQQAPEPQSPSSAPASRQSPPRRERRYEPGEERGDGRFPRGLALRLFVYVVAGHLLAGFLFLLFELGGGK